MSGGVPAGLLKIAQHSALNDPIADMPMAERGAAIRTLRAMLSAIPAPTPPIEGRDADVERDAARWRALMSSDRIRMMGRAGFDTAADGTITLRDWDGWHHMGIEVWDRHPAKGDDSDSHGRKVLLAYVDARAALQALGERG